MIESTNKYEQKNVFEQSSRQETFSEPSSFDNAK
jgi:hypothetical protein